MKKEDLYDVLRDVFYGAGNNLQSHGGFCLQFNKHNIEDLCASLDNIAHAINNVSESLDNVERAITGLELE